MTSSNMSLTAHVWSGLRIPWTSVVWKPFIVEPVWNWGSRGHNIGASLPQRSPIDLLLYS